MPLLGIRNEPLQFACQFHHQRRHRTNNNRLFTHTLRTVPDHAARLVRGVDHDIAVDHFCPRAGIAQPNDGNRQIAQVPGPNPKGLGQASKHPGRDEVADTESRHIPLPIRERRQNAFPVAIGLHRNADCFPQLTGRKLHRLLPQESWGEPPKKPYGRRRETSISLFYFCS